MHSDAEAGRREEVRRASNRGAGHRTVKRTQLVFCCHGSTEGERFLSIRKSYHRYVPTPKPVSPVCHVGGFEYCVG